MTIVAIFIGAWWFFRRRSLAGILQTTLTLKSVASSNKIPIAIIGVHIKNVGQTRVKRETCFFSSQTAQSPLPETQFIPVQFNAIPVDKTADATVQEIFKSLAALEPNEELSEDVALNVQPGQLFQVAVEFSRRKTWPTQTNLAAWTWTAIFSASDKEVET